MTEIHPAGELVGTDHAGWSAELQDEVVSLAWNGRVGQVLVHESSDARTWTIDLRPGERLPFTATSSTTPGSQSEPAPAVNTPRTARRVW